MAVVILPNSPYNGPSMPRRYMMPLLPEMKPHEFFVPATDDAPVTAIAPILVTVQEEVQLKYGPRKPVIHWEDVPAESYPSALEAIIRQAVELKAMGIEPRFTMNGKAVDLDGPINFDH
jgi:hypothetical protein